MYRKYYRKPPLLEKSESVSTVREDSKLQLRILWAEFEASVAEAMHPRPLEMKENGFNCVITEI